MDKTQDVTVQLKPWANPTPAGLVALAVACLSFFALLNGYVGAGASTLLGCWLIGGFIVQVIVAISDLRSGNTAGGNTFLYFSAFFMFTSGIKFLVEAWAGAHQLPLDGHMDGWAWVALALVGWLWTPAFLKVFNLLSIVILGLDVAVPCVALTFLGIWPAGFAKIAAWAFLVSAVTAIYLSAGQVVNTTYGKKVYPLLEVGGKK